MHLYLIIWQCFLGIITSFYKGTSIFQELFIISLNILSAFINYWATKSLWHTCWGFGKSWFHICYFTRSLWKWNFLETVKNNCLHKMKNYFPYELWKNWSNIFVHHQFSTQICHISKIWATYCIYFLIPKSSDCKQSLKRIYVLGS